MTEIFGLCFKVKNNNCLRCRNVDATGIMNEMLFFLIIPPGCVQRLPDPAMLTQGSQGVRHCNDTERRVSILEMSSCFTWTNVLFFAIFKVHLCL